MALQRLPKDYITFPLDVPSVAEAERYIEMLSDHVGMFKIGLELFIHAGPELVRGITRAGTAKVFLDLKLHDIPATVSRAMARVADLGVSFVTVHCAESGAMLRAAVEGSGGRVGVLGVTVLTSVDCDDLESAGFKDEYATNITRMVEKRAAMAHASGCAGVICSGMEVEMIKQKFGRDFLGVTPGIRVSDGTVAGDDQKRVVTPSIAIQRGADHLVIGRPIRDAQDPPAAARRIAEEVETALALSGKSAE
jgi:orotidine-5'-phosphate decarboxylase